MEPKDTTQLRHILERMTTGIALIDCSTLHIRYANAAMIAFCPEAWRPHGVEQQDIREILPPELSEQLLPLVQQVYTEGRSLSFAEVPYKGFLETRGRTYWRLSLEPAEEGSVLIILEDLTSSVRARLQMEAIRHISAAIAGQSPLHDVLDRILLAMYDLIGSKRCAVLLIDEEGDEIERATTTMQAASGTEAATQTITLIAYQGLYAGAEDWHPQVNERLLISKVLQTRQSLIVHDTSIMPEIEFPILNDGGQPRRPGSVACVPILETRPDGMPGAILGTIEVYHRHPRSLPKEEIELLEQFAPQAGLAIQNARLFQRTKRLARVASQQAHQLENVMQAIPDGVIIYDADWCLLEINHMARTLLGWSNEELGLPIQEALSLSKARFPQNSPQIVDMMADLERLSEAHPVDEFEMIGANGQRYTMRRSKAPIQDETGQIFAYVVVYHDVTEQAVARRQIEEEVRARTAELALRNAALQETQAELRLYNDRLQLLLERLPAGVMVISLEGHEVVLMNSQARQLLQRMGIAFMVSSSRSRKGQIRTADIRIEELLRTITMYDTAGIVVPYEQQPLYQALYHEEASEAELYTFQADGQILNLLVNASPLRASNNAAINVVLVWQDITWIKALERAREDFFTIMAHELKTPMANIRAHLSALQARDLTWSAEEERQFLYTADEQVERLVGMINHFLDASRVEAGALRPELEPILLPEMFEDLEDRLEALITSSQRRLEIALPARLPAVLADYELIMSVLTNLLSNAFRYAPVGDTVRIEAEVLFEQDQAQGVRVSVIDHGPGITSERQAELFTRFSTFAAVRRPTAGRPGQIAEEISEKRRSGVRWSPATGLGLYISKGILEAHGSSLEVQSHPGEGATFAFTLALAHPAS